MIQTPAIEVENLMVKFDAKRILEEFSLCLAPGEKVVLTGRSGSGKSTTLAGMVNYVNENHYGHILTIGSRGTEEVFVYEKKELDETSEAKTLLELLREVTSYLENPNTDYPIKIFLAKYKNGSDYIYC